MTFEDKLKEFVSKQVDDYHRRRMEKLDQLSFAKVIARKNPYLLRVANPTSSLMQLVQQELVSYLGDQAETLFGQVLEQTAIFVCAEAFGGWKSGIEGIDMEMDRDGWRHIISIKSGPAWSNSSSIEKMKDDFRRAKKILATTGGIETVRAINGCCYGIDDKPNKGDYLKLCGQRFWEYISGQAEMYSKLMTLFEEIVGDRQTQFDEAHARLVEKFTNELRETIGSDQGKIDWQKLVRLNSGRTD
jgi:Type II restriction endonuclease EcoO109I